MPRFSFPVPRRRQKQAAASVTSPPLNKVQKFLGAAEINVDAQASPEADAARNWDARSDSCISISLSESSAGQDDSILDRALSSLAGNRVVNDTTYRQPLFDEESGVFPRNQNDPRFGEAGTVANTADERSTTDASSLRRQQSSSTITSYYDKSKVPLVISQQTSSSAMAKGLPQKASDLLDIGGTLANHDKQKSRPPRLDLAHLLPRRRPSNSALAVSSSERGFVLGPDKVTRSPPFLSGSPLEYAARPRNGHRNEKKLQKRPIRGSVRCDATNGQPKHQGMSEQEASGLQNLYEHYAQMSIRDTTVQEHIPVPAVPESTPEEWSPQKYRLREADKSQVDYTHQVPKDISVTSSVRESTRSHFVSIPKPNGNGASGLYSPASESVSSYQTRTSKVSRQTSRSLLDADLHQTSVLSLSSDSEDDIFCRRGKASVATISKSPPTKKDTRASAYHQAPTSRSSSSEKEQRARPGNTGPAVYGQDSHMLSIPDRRPRATNPPRTSAASASTAKTVKPATVSLRSSSRTSRTSATSSNTSNSPVPPSYTVHEARAITLVPAQVASYTLPSTQDGSSPSDQMTPPLSPMSVEFCLRTSRTPGPDFDQGSVRSGHSFGTVGSSRSGNTTYRHVMTVTRQEELLLAALRRKKTTMRDAIISEYEKGQEKEQAIPRPPRRRSSNSTFELQTVRSKSADRSPASSRDLLSHFEGGSTVGSQSVHTFDGERSSMNYSMEFDDGCSGSVDSSDSYLFRTPTDQSPIGPPTAGRHENRALHASVAGGRHGTKPHRQVLDDMQFHSHLHPLDDRIEVQILDERSGTEENLPGIPRPDSPIEAQLPLPRKKGVRISAVGRPGEGPGWW